MKIFEIIIFGCIGGFLLWIIDWKINRLAVGAPLKLLLSTLLGGGLFQGGITIHKTTHKTESGFFVKWTFRDWLGLCILIVVVFALLSGVIPAGELLDKLLKKS